MTKNVETIQPTKTTFDAIQVMKSKGFRAPTSFRKKENNWNTIYEGSL